jgi:DNA-binding PadR family transcriptional regulator
MPATAPPSLSLAESLVLGVLCEQPLHGFAIARLLGPAGDLGQIWRVPKPVVYRALQRLEHLGLVTTTGQQPSSRGPVKSPVDVTEAGRQLAGAWLNVPVSHNRDVRSELLIKLALLDRAGLDAQPLLAAQRAQIIPVAEALRDRLAGTAGFERTLALWRYETVSATVRFLDALQSRDIAGERAPVPRTAARG